MRESGILRPSATRRTPRVNQCLILAAGNGSRLIAASGGSPQPLVQLHGKSLLEHVILGAHEAGIHNFVIVIGYGANAMRQWLADRWLGSVSVTVVDNFEYHKANGVSVLKARDLVRDTFLLLIADHIFEPRTARALLEEPLTPGEVLLGLDPKLDRILILMTRRSETRTAIRSWISASRSPTTTPTIQACSCAAKPVFADTACREGRGLLSIWIVNPPRAHGYTNQRSV